MKRDLTSLLLDLRDAEIEFILVGGLAAVIQGVPFATFDVDILHRRTEENAQRVLRLLHDNGAYARGRPEGQRLLPDLTALRGPGHQLLMTDRGALDLLGAVERGLTYDDLLPLAQPLELRGRTIQVLGLEALLDLKQDATHPKDVAQRMLLEEALTRIRGD